MPETVLRRGVVEIETLRRWGRVPIGTRAAGEITLTRYANTADPWVQYALQIADDPRWVRAMCLLNGFPRNGVIRMRRYVRGVLTPFEGDLFDYALSRVTDALEGENTPSGYQRFRVLRAEWTDPRVDLDAHE